MSTAFKPQTEVTKIPTSFPEVKAGDVKTADGKNKVLRMVKKLRMGGPPVTGLVYLIVTIVAAYQVPLINVAWDLNKRNRHFHNVMLAGEEMASMSMNNIGHYVSPDIFEPSDRSAFNGVVADRHFLGLMTRTFEKHLQTSRTQSSNNPGATEAYHEMIAKALVLIERLSTMGPFDIPLTQRERAIVERYYRELAKEDPNKYVKHYTNENACTYLALGVDIWARFMNEVEDPNAHSLQDRMQACRSLFACVHHRSHESGAKLLKTIQNNGCGTYLDVPAREFWIEQVTSNRFALLDDSKRITSNAKFTVKRLNRLTSMITGMPSLWGIGIHFSPAMLPVLIALDKYEQMLGDTRAPIAHSLTWYIVLGKEKIINPLTDHQRRDAETVIANVIGRAADARPPRVRPDAIPFFADSNIPCQFPQATDFKADEKDDDKDEEDDEDDTDAGDDDDGDGTSDVGDDGDGGGGGGGGKADDVKGDDSSGEPKPTKAVASVVPPQQQVAAATTSTSQTQQATARRASRTKKGKARITSAKTKSSKLA